MKLLISAFLAFSITASWSQFNNEVVDSLFFELDDFHFSEDELPAIDSLVEVIEEVCTNENILEGVFNAHLIPSQIYRDYPIELTKKHIDKLDYLVTTRGKEIGDSTLIHYYY